MNTASRRGPLVAAVAVGLLAAVAVVVAVVVRPTDRGGGSVPTTSAASCAEGPPEPLSVQVLRRVPHPVDAFTEGLVRVEGSLWESTGLEGHSRIQRLRWPQGTVAESADLDPHLFGEGLAVGDGGELVQLTWKDHVALRWDRRPLQRTGQFDFEGEGWGLTTLEDGTLVQSDGSDRLTLRDPGTFEVTGTRRITRVGGAADRLNELEWDGEHLWANRWQTDEVLRIDLACNRVDAVADATALTTEARAAAPAGVQVDVLNGIALGPAAGEYVLTGKFFPLMFLVRFDPR